MVSTVYCFGYRLFRFYLRVIVCSQDCEHIRVRPGPWRCLGGRLPEGRAVEVERWQQVEVEGQLGGGAAGQRLDLARA